MKKFDQTIPMVENLTHIFLKNVKKGMYLLMTGVPLSAIKSHSISSPIRNVLYKIHTKIPVLSSCMFFFKFT